MTDPREAALDVVQRAFDERVDLFIAMQYLNMLPEGALEPLRRRTAEQDTIITRILRVPPVPDPEYARPSRREREQRAIAQMGHQRRRVRIPEVEPEMRAFRSSNAKRSRRGERSLFARWVDGEVEATTDEEVAALLDAIRQES
jgi:hypothetical protein